MESNQQEWLLKRLTQSKEHIIRCMLNFMKETERIKEEMEQRGMNTMNITSTLTLKQAHKQKLEAYLIAVQLFKSNPNKCFSLTLLRKHVQQHVDYALPSNTSFIEKIQEINPFIRKVRRGCYQYIDHL
ncbi:hypothetical protein [Priestia filamentosa]|uniref:Repressor Rok winged helix domain-containing protein n=1 Tax=Priestia filamentosa TaxID=1402861 RepID=A0A2L1FFP4_9BACI|nr:hypothetical protein [Priestia filamentosa]AVD54577.1 hypothetical protein CKF96_03500 [Priestia filamentosa]AWG44917.1 hypothetical protein BEH_24785 [Priestia filamentosa]RJS63149.1 hypothetical protein CJ485_23400 [Priestia filamentosa]